MLKFSANHEKNFLYYYTKESLKKTSMKHKPRVYTSELTLVSQQRHNQGVAFVKVSLFEEHGEKVEPTRSLLHSHTQTFKGYFRTTGLTYRSSCRVMLHAHSFDTPTLKQLESEPLEQLVSVSSGSNYFRKIRANPCSENCGFLPPLSTSSTENRVVSIY